MYKLYFGLAGGAFSLFGWLLSSDATRSANGSHYSFMLNPLAYGAYVAAVIGVAGLTGGLLSLRLTRHVFPLGDDALRAIKETSANSDYMEAMKQRLLSDYNKMWVQITGSVSDVGEWNGWSRRLAIRTCEPGLIANAYFNNRGARNRILAVLPRGTRVTVIGKIKRIEEGSITLVRCELIEWQDRVSG
jgi:hypothetical protein